MNALVESPAPRAVTEASVVAGAPIRSLVPTSLEGAWRVAQLLAASPFTPKDMKQPEACAAAIMFGMDLGITPVQAVQSIAVINGRPSIWGDLALALVRADKRCEDVEELVSGDGDRRVATCTARRAGAKPTVRSFSVEDAKKAGLWGKAGPWQQYPARMLQLRARAFALRDAFPDILKGIAIREEVEDIQFREVPDDAQPRRQPPAPPKQIEQKAADPKPTSPPPQIRDAERDAAEARAEREPVTVTSGAQPDQQQDSGERVPDYDGQALLAEFSEALDGFESIDAIDEWLGKTKGKPNRGMVIVEALNPGDQQEARELYRQAKARIEDHAAAGQHDEQQAEERAAAPADDDDSDFPGDRPSQQLAIEKDPAQMNDAELESYIRDWITASTDAVVMKKRWFAEAELRDNLDPKVAGELRALWKKRSDELGKA